ncbi:hypothetical protein HPB52_023491 [Rhipicephalus sanguineus]|uniref:Uncharacterized protein n=1 Tax=Rhipicephalus sanguineus TaxID=34632 RepID=A0A9D4TBZ8_RHISA|nr:hypothetical protein HPB52_023491 [Rhipicephalus sanguineus]
MHRRAETTTTRNALRTEEFVVLRGDAIEEAAKTSKRRPEITSEPATEPKRHRHGSCRLKSTVRRLPKRHRAKATSGDGQGVTTASGTFTSVVPLPVILCVMDTRFAHLNPDRRSPAMRRGSGSEDEGVQGNPQVVVAPESQRNEHFGELTRKRRLEERDPCSELRRYSKVLTGVLPKFPTEAEAPVWFESVESALEAYEVRGEFWGRLVFPLVAERVPFLSTRLSPIEHKDYQVIKQTVLAELWLSAGEYLKRFSGSGKRANEGWRPFASRLENYLHFYLDARGVSTFEGLVKLLVADQLKKNLSEEAVRYVTLQEGRKTFEEAQGANSAARQTQQKSAESQSASSARPDNETTKARNAGKSLGVGNSEVGGAQLELEHEPLHAVVVQQQDEGNTRAQSVERHATEEIDDTQLTPDSRPLRTLKVQKLDVESSVLEAQGEIATMEGVITQAVVRSADGEGPRGSRASPGETQAASKQETSALQITGAGQDGIVERHGERSCFVRVPTGPRNLVRGSKLRPRCPRSELKGVLFEEGDAASDVACAPMATTAQVGKRKRSQASEVFGRHGGPLGGEPNVISGRQREDVVRAGFTRKSKYCKGETTGRVDQLLDWDPRVQSLALRRINDRGLWPPPTVTPDTDTLSRVPNECWEVGSGASGVETPED